MNKRNLIRRVILLFLLFILTCSGIVHRIKHNSIRCSIKTLNFDEKGLAMTNNERIFWGVPIDPNSANLEELMQIEGIGAKRAEAILNLKKEKGVIKYFDEIQNLSGFDKKTIENLRKYFILK